MGIMDRIRAGLRATVAPALPDRSALSLDGFGRSRRDAARSDLPELAGWRPGLGYAGDDLFGERDAIMGRARDLDANNGWVNGGIDRRVEAVVGVNIKLNAQPIYALLNKDYAWRQKWAADVQNRFKVWGGDIEFRCDARQRMSFGALARVAYLSYFRDGEAAAEIRDIDRGLANPTSILLIEPERISSPRDRSVTEGPLHRGGIDYDRNGAPIAYWVRSGHPSDPAPGYERERWSRIARFSDTGRARFVHIYSPRRVEQNRGISRLAEAMVPAKMLDRVDRAEVTAALKSALLSIFIKSPGSADDVRAALVAPGSETGQDRWLTDYVEYRSRNPVQLDGAQLVQLLPDEDIKVPERGAPNANYADFLKFVLQKVAGSLGVSYPQISQNWADINYSSARALLNELWRSFTQDRTYFSQHFLAPIYAAWLEWEVANGHVKVPGGPSAFYRHKTAICNCEFIGPGRGSVDPLKEANANNLDTAAGRMSTVEAILERGRDPDDVMAEEQYWLGERRKRDLPVPNHNVKADAAGGQDGNASGTEQDRDGDGIPNEDKRKKPVEGAVP